MKPVLCKDEDDFDGGPNQLTTLSSIERCARGQDPRSFIVMCANEEVHIAGLTRSWLSAIPLEKRHNTPWPCYTLSEIRAMAKQMLPGKDSAHIGVKACFDPGIPGYRPVFEEVAL